MSKGIIKSVSSLVVFGLTYGTLVVLLRFDAWLGGIVGVAIIAAIGVSFSRSVKRELRIVARRDRRLRRVNARNSLIALNPPIAE